VNQNQLSNAEMFAETPIGLMEAPTAVEVMRDFQSVSSGAKQQIL